MRRRLTCLLVWAFATAGTAGVIHWQVRSVPGPPVPLSAADLSSAAPSVPVRAPAPVRSPAPAAAAPATTPTPGWVAAPDGRGGTAQRRLFRVQGGEVEFYCARGDVHVVGLAPRPGFTHQEIRLSAESVRVSLFTDGHISRVWVSWRGGCYGEVAESV